MGVEEVSGAICEKGDEEKEEEDDGTAVTEELVLSMGSVLDDVGTGCGLELATTGDGEEEEDGLGEGEGEGEGGRVGISKVCPSLTLRIE